MPDEPHVDPDAAWAIARDPGSRRTVIVRAAFDEVSADRRIAEIVAAAADGGTSAIWWLAPHHRPADLADRLSGFGFREEGASAAMTLDLATLPAALDVSPPGLVIAPVSDLDGASGFAAVHMADRAAAGHRRRRRTVRHRHRAGGPRPWLRPGDDARGARRGRGQELRIAALQASDMGYPICRRVEFEEQFRYTLFIRPADT